MTPSTLQTMQTPATGGASPATVAKAGDVPLRVYISNVGGAVVVVSFSASNLNTTAATTSCFRILQNRDATFVLAPRQSLFAASAGMAGMVSVAVSEALPIDAPAATTTLATKR